MSAEPVDHLKLPVGLNDFLYKTNAVILSMLQFYPFAAVLIPHFCLFPDILPKMQKSEISMAETGNTRLANA